MEPIEVEESLDLITDLPNHVRALIISRLPLGEAATTTTLSTKWWNLWRSATRLDIDPRTLTMQCRRHDVMSPHPQFFHFFQYETIRRDLLSSGRQILQILRNHRSDIKSCNIIHLGNSIKNGQVERWIKCLKVKRIQELSLHIVEVPFIPQLGLVRNSSFALPEGAFRSATLTTLELNNYVRIRRVDPFLGCDNIKTLKLKSVGVRNLLLEDIISNCRCLEEIVLWKCFGFQNLQISSSTLKVMELVGLSVDVLRIQAEALMILVLDSITCSRNKRVINTPKLVTLRTTFKACEATLFIPEGQEEFLDSRELIEDSVGTLGFGSGNVRPFMNLRELSICWDLNNAKDVQILATMFRVYPHLEVIKIISQVKARGNPDRGSQVVISASPDEFWDERETIHSLENVLKAVKILGFRGDTISYRFVRFLITKGKMLRRLSIQCFSDCKDNEISATSSLMSLPRASPNFAIDLKAGENCPAKY